MGGGEVDRTVGQTRTHQSRRSRPRWPAPWLLPACALQVLVGCLPALCSLFVEEERGCPGLLLRESERARCMHPPEGVESIGRSNGAHTTTHTHIGARACVWSIDRFRTVTAQKRGAALQRARRRLQRLGYVWLGYGMIPAPAGGGGRSLVEGPLACAGRRLFGCPCSCQRGPCGCRRGSGSEQGDWRGLVEGGAGEGW